MATRTTADLCLRVSQLLNRRRPGQQLSATDVDTISTIYSNVLAELVDTGAAYWSTDEIPAAAFERLSLLIAVDCASAFGALPIILQAIGASNALEARDYCIQKLRIHVEREPDLEMQHEKSDWM